MSRRTELLEFAVLGLLHESPHARLRAAQAAQRRARRLPGAVLRHALPVPAGAARAGLDHRAPTEPRRPAPREPAGPDRLRAHRRRQGALPGPARARPAPTPGTTTPSTSTSPSSPAPRPRSGCASSRVAAAGLEERLPTSAPPPPRTASGSTPTPPPCSGTAMELAEREVRWLNELITPSAARTPTRSRPPPDAPPSTHHHRTTTPRCTPPTTRSNPWDPFASPSSASATAPARWSRASSTTRTPTRRAPSPASCTSRSVTTTSSDVEFVAAFDVDDKKVG